MAEDAVEYILDTHYSLWEWDDDVFRERVADRIEADAELGRVRDGAAAAAAYERWEWTTRMTTFTNGDCRLYEWFGLDWWLPLWDRDYVEFWASVPLAHRRGKRLQREYTKERFAEVGNTEAAVADRTSRDWTPLDQIRRTFETRPERTYVEHLGAAGTGFDAWLGDQAVPDGAAESRGKYPLRWYGIYPEEARERFEPAKNLYALRTLAALGLLSFDPPRSDASLRGELSLPPLPDG
jgi:asparagine synthase (glutamine-hydrolysing)